MKRFAFLSLFTLLLPLLASAQGFSGGGAAKAIGGSFLKPFGGIISAMIPCTSPPGGQWLTIGPPVPAVVLYQPGASKLYLNFKPFPGSWVLGQASRTAGTCILGVCPYCLIFPYQGIIQKFGTS